MHTRFLYALWMASSASLIVTPFMFRAVTSFPSLKWRSIFLTLGFVRGSLRIAGSSMPLGLWLIFLYHEAISRCRCIASRSQGVRGALTIQSSASRVRAPGQFPSPLRTCISMNTIASYSDIGTGGICDVGRIRDWMHVWLTEFVDVHDIGSEGALPPVSLLQVVGGGR